MKYFIYCRKSSEAEDRQVASIESQLTTLKRTFAGRSDIEIVGVYEEAYSAKAPGRLRFTEMLQKIEEGLADGIIAWAPDRIARNSIDGGRVIYMLDCGVIRDLKFATYTFENNSQGKFMLQIMFGQSKYYSDALSDNVKRGNRSKLEKGWWPNRPPLGYRNDPATRTIKKDPERFKRVRDIFDLFLNGSSTREIWRLAREEWDLRTPRSRSTGGRLIALSYMHKILTNPFYAGILIWNGKTYDGAHDPVVSLEEFERVQRLLRKPEKQRPHARTFAFTGMIRCGECGFLVTAEEQLNRHGKRYTYYHCTKRRTDYRCRQPYVPLASVEDQIELFLGGLSLPDRIHEWAVRHSSANDRQEREAIEERRRALAKADERARTALETLTSLRIRDLIGDDEFVRERQKLEVELARLRQQTEKAGETDLTFEPLETLVSFRNRATDWFRAGDNDTKHSILRIVGSNPVLKDKILSIEAKRPFRTDLKMLPQLKLRAVRDEIRTLWINRDPELVEIIEGIRALEAKLGSRSGDDRHRAA